MPIDKYCDEQRHSTEKRLRLFQTVCSAVAYAHRNLIVHREAIEATPYIPNVIVSSSEFIRPYDFGIPLEEMDAVWEKAKEKE